MSEKKTLMIEKAVEKWQLDDVEDATLFIAKSPFGGYNGYVQFSKRPSREKGYDGFLAYVPVHGGITYADGDGTYGFDTSHSGDFATYRDGSTMAGKIWTLEEVKKETENMAHALLAVKRYERRYLRCITDKGKAKVIDEYHEELRKQGIKFNLTDNFGAMLNTLCGSL